MMHSRDEQAVRLFDDAIAALTAQPKDIELAVRKYASACELMSWRDEADMAWAELAGYTADNVPPHRIVTAALTWTPAKELGLFDQTHAASHYVVGGGQLPPDESIDWYLFASLADVIRYRSAGFATLTGAPRQSYDDGRRSYPFDQVSKVPPASLETLLDRVERWIFRASVSGGITVRYGSTVESLWGAFRERLDEPLATMGLTDHLDQIENGIGALTQPGRNSALYGCRTLLEALSEKLWLDERETYEPLPGGGPGGRLDVSRGNMKNRLAAYIHQQLGNTKVRRYLAAELERLEESLRRLYDLTSEAHDLDVSQADAESAVVGSYLLVAELARRTGLKPVEKYKTAGP